MYHIKSFNRKVLSAQKLSNRKIAHKHNIYMPVKKVVFVDLCPVYKNKANIVFCAVIYTGLHVLYIQPLYIAI